MFQRFETSIQMWYSSLWSLSILISFHEDKNLFHHMKSRLISKIIWWCWVLRLRASKRRRRNARFEITTLTTNERNSINDWKSECVIVVSRKAFVTNVIIFNNFFWERRIFMTMLFNSMSKNSTVMSQIFFLWFTLKFNKSHNSSNWRWYSISSISKCKMAKKSFK